MMRFFKNFDFWNNTKDLCALVLGFFSLYTAATGVLPPIYQRSIHLLLILLIIFSRSAKAPGLVNKVINISLFLLTIICFTFLISNYRSIALRIGILTKTEIILGIIGIILILEATRRVIGWPIVIIALFFVVYILIGQHFPGILEHRGYPLVRTVKQFFYSTGGIFGIPLGASATFVVLFIIFGAFLQASGGADFLMDLAIGLTGHTRGGPGKVAVVGSAFMGTISGSAVANVVTTGTFTIPLMKNVGYKPHFAGAVEAASSTGSQIMPPIMGAAAFIMVEITGISYINIAAAALIPSLIFYLSLFSTVHFEALKNNLGKMSKTRIPDLKGLLVKRFHLVLPVIQLVTLLVMGRSPMYSVFYSIVGIVVVSWFRRETRMNIRMIISAIKKGAEGTVIVATACATAGLVAGVISLSGLGLKVSSILSTLAGPSMIFALIFTMFTCIILGMGLPTAPVYILVASLMAPALINLGVTVLGAHLFVFYSALLSAITPPVAVAAYAAAGIAEDSPMKIAVTACRIGLVLFIIPYFFVYQPALIAQGNLLTVISVSIVAIIGAVAISSSMVGFFLVRSAFIERLFLFSGGLSLIHRSVLTDTIGFSLFLIVIISQIIRKKRIQEYNDEGGENV